MVHKTDNNKDKKDTKGGSVCENVANRGEERVEKKGKGNNEHKGERVRVRD